MPRILRLPSLLVLVSVALMILGEYTGPAPLVYITKPFTMACILSIALLNLWEVGASRYGLLVMLAIAIAAVGNILLMLPTDKFVEGLVAFLIAHLVYIAAFVGGVGWRGSIQRALLFTLYGVVIGVMLWPGLGEMRVPVVAYIVVIMLMGWRAWERSARLATLGTHLAALGALLLILADTILALNKFSMTFAAGPALNLTAYFAAQWLLALSIRRQAPA